MKNRFNSTQVTVVRFGHRRTGLTLERALQIWWWYCNGKVSAVLEVVADAIFADLRK